MLRLMEMYLGFLGVWSQTKIFQTFNLTMTPAEQLLTCLHLCKCTHYIVPSQIPQLNKKSSAQVMAAFC